MRTLTFLLLFAISCADLRGEEGLIFYVPFDNFKVDAVIAGGDPRSSFTESIELRNYPGVKGGALMLQQNERCEYDLKGNLNPKQGTIAFWIKPVNWDGDDRMFHHFVCIVDEKAPSRWYIYKYSSNNNLLFYISSALGGRRRSIYCGTSIEPWKRGRWHHIAATWDANEMRLYIDGKRVGRQLIPKGLIPAEMDGKLSLIPVQFWKNQWTTPEERTLIDEVKIFNRPLSDREIIELYDELNPYGSEEERKPSLMVSLKPDVERRELIATIAAIHLDDSWKKAMRSGARMKVVLHTPNGTSERRFIPFEIERALRFAVKQWQVGEYRIEAAVSHSGKSLKAQASVRKPPTPWLDKKPGAEFLDAVLPPWTPLKRSGDVVSCWGRAVTFGDSPFPVAIQSLGEELLAQPIRLVGRINGGDFEARGESKLVGESDARVIYEGSQKIAGATISWRTMMEFDGMIRCDFTITPENKTRIERLAIEIPMRIDFIRYIRTPKRRDWKDDAFESPFLNYVWVGNEYRGFCWFMESDANFKVKPETDVVSVSRRTGLAGITIIDEPVETDEVLRYTIGFQATPLKPLPKGWQGWRLGNPRYKHCNMMIHGWGPRAYTLAGSLVPLDIKRHMENLKKWHDMGVKIYSYTCCGCAADLLDEWQFFEAEWFNAYGSSFPGYKRYPDNAPYTLRAVCPGSSYADFLVWRVENLMKNGWADGVYTDIDGANPCDNSLHGCGYVDAFGRRGKTVPIFKHRDLSKRIYGFCHKYGGRYLSHAHNRFIAPYHAFIDGWCPGEHYSVAVIGHHTFYMDGMKLDDWRAEYLSPTTGVVTFMLPQWGRISPERDRQIRFPTENLVAMAALHNVPIWAGFTNVDVINEYWSVLVGFGVEDAEFQPYWEEPPLRAETRGVRVSVYSKPRKMLAVVVNFSEEDKRAELLLDSPARAAVVKMPVGAKATGGGKRWSVPVRRKNFALIQFDF